MAKLSRGKALSAYAINVQLGEELYRQVEELAEAKDVSKSWVLRQALKLYLKAERQPEKPAK